MNINTKIFIFLDKSMFLGGIFIHLLKKNPISTSKTSILSNTFNQIIKRAIHKIQNALKKPQTVVYRAVFQRHSSPRSPTKSPWLIGFLPILYIRVRAYVSVYAYITNDIQKVVFFVIFWFLRRAHQWGDKRAHIHFLCIYLQGVRGKRIFLNLVYIRVYSRWKRKNKCNAYNAYWACKTC